MTARGIVGGAIVGELGLGQGDGVAVGPAFNLSPSAIHHTGAVSITATFTGGAVAPVSNPFSVASGPASGISGYVKTSTTTATFNLNVTAISSTPIVIADSLTSTTQPFSAAAVAPAAPTIGSATPGNAQATVAFTAPADNGGSTILGYTVFASTGQTAAGGASPIVVPGLANGVSVSFTVVAINAIGQSNPSGSTSAVVPVGPAPTAATVQQIAPFLSTDTLTAPGYAVYSGAGALLNANVTSGLVVIANVPNGRLAAIPLTADSFGGFNGYALWQTGSSPNVFAPRELYLPPLVSNSLSTGKITKLTVFPFGTPMTSPGYQLFQNLSGVYTAIGSRTAAGVTAIPNVTTGRSVELTLPLAADKSFRGIIVWDNGAGVFTPPDEVFISPIQAASTSVGGIPPAVGSLLLRKA